jgi:hypothetical protein
VNTAYSEGFLAILAMWKVKSFESYRITTIPSFKYLRKAAFKRRIGVDQFNAFDEKRRW